MNKIKHLEISGEIYGTITLEEYEEWKINWPYTSDMCGHAVPRNSGKSE